MANLFNILSSFNFAGVSFVNIKGYCSDKSGNSEIADTLMNVGASIENAKAKDLEDLKNANLLELVNDDFDLETLELARAEKMQSIVKPNENRSNGQKDAFMPLCNGVKFCLATESIIINGFRVRKTIIRKGEFKAVKSSKKTLAKKYLDKVLDLRMAKFRYMKLSNILGEIKVNGDTLEIG